ncbi:MAG TPA: hypothetical protein VFQ65_04805 [Kofleriaceae bacterium]|nr:hypothetical protein [Kofleriaceae bacterium]
MAEVSEGAPIAKDAIDPELVKLSRPRPKIGVITAAGLVFLCVFFLIKLQPDRRFAGAGDAPTRVAVADITSGKVGADAYVKLEAAELVMSHAIRASTNRAGLGLRIAPVRGTGEKLWIAMSGDGWEQPSLGAYTGRLRELGKLPFAPALNEYAQDHPRPVFAAAPAVRAAFATGKLTAITGDELAVADTTKVGFDTTDPNSSIIVATFNARLPNSAAWERGLAAAGITVIGSHDPMQDTIRFDATGDPAHLTAQLLDAKLWAARVEPTTHHYDTTWGALKTSSPAGFVVGATVIPDSQLDLIGLYVTREIPAGAYALITDEHPEEYWYVLPITIALAAIGLVFAWALVRAVKRDLLPTRA